MKTCHNDSFNDSDTLQYNDRLKRSALDIAMEKHIEYITNVEGRLFTYFDFISFEVDGIEYNMSHGTFRNKISQLKRANKVTLVINSILGFYTIKGHKLSKRMTPNHTMVTPKRNINRNNPTYKMLENLPFERQSIHNIRLKFEVPNLWITLSQKNNPNLELSKNKRSKDISVPIHIQSDTVDIKVSIHKTDTVSVIIGCSLDPIRLDYDGIIKFYTLLARIEEQLRSYVNLNVHVNNNNATDTAPAISVPVVTNGNVMLTTIGHNNIPSLLIPDNKQWTITMWHFGRDSLTEYTGQKYSITVQEAQGVLSRIYSKNINGKSKIRVESQEYPKKTVIEAINAKYIDNKLID